MTDRATCPHCASTQTHLVEVSGLYDGGLYYECPHCGATWHRWSPLHWQHRKAERFIHGPHPKEKHNG